MMDLSGGYKYLTAERLIGLLTSIPGDSQVIPNRVGNLLVLTADGREDVGFVDFSGSGEVEIYE
jgi:hypothetical protein